MRLRSVVLFVALLLVVATTATGTQSFSAGELGRGLSVAVASDEDAYLGYAADVDENRTLTVELTNALPGTQTLDVVVEVSNGSTTETNATTLSPGQQDAVEFGDVSCDAVIDAVGTGESVRIELTRAVPCDGTTEFVSDDGDSQGDEGGGGDSQGGEDDDDDDTTDEDN